MVERNSQRSSSRNINIDDNIFTTEVKKRDCNESRRLKKSMSQRLQNPEIFSYLSKWENLLDQKGNEVLKTNRRSSSFRSARRKNVFSTCSFLREEFTEDNSSSKINNIGINDNIDERAKTENEYAIINKIILGSSPRSSKSTEEKIEEKIENENIEERKSCDSFDNQIKPSSQTVKLPRVVAFVYKKPLQPQPPPNKNMASPDWRQQ